ncbi:MAG: HD domain-containing protein [Candidatus Eremiobacteraeota bacterium]|nr:HD domain-containing protein [Candidatus Eremiobacteraeota bacterium]
MQLQPASEHGFTARFDRALAVAARLHAGQFRKATSRPYIGHLLGVCSIVIDADGTEDEAIAALLHDAVEDCGGAPTLTMIREDFGDVVAGIVEHCSDAMPEFGKQKAPFVIRKGQYQERLRSADDSTLLVSAADKLYNLRSIWSDFQTKGDTIYDRFVGDASGTSEKRRLTLWNYDALVGIYEAAKGPDGRRVRIVAELRELLAKLERGSAAL